MTLEKFTERKSPATGKPYPRCQFSSRDGQCDKTTYSDGLCWSHYRKDALTYIDGRPRQVELDRIKGKGK